MLEDMKLTAAARAVIDTAPWLAIATSGKDGPHLAACFSHQHR